MHPPVIKSVGFLILMLSLSQMSEGQMSRRAETRTRHNRCQVIVIHATTTKNVRQQKQRAVTEEMKRSQTGEVFTSMLGRYCAPGQIGARMSRCEAPSGDRPHGDDRDPKRLMMPPSRLTRIVFTKGRAGADDLLLRRDDELLTGREGGVLRDELFGGNRETLLFFLSFLSSCPVHLHVIWWEMRGHHRLFVSSPVKLTGSMHMATQAIEN